jgi:hypothetical protein
LCAYKIHFSSSENKSVTANTLLCFIKNYCEPRFRFIQPSSTAYGRPKAKANHSIITKRHHHT